MQQSKCKQSKCNRVSAADNWWAKEAGQYVIILWLSRRFRGKYPREFCKILGPILASGLHQAETVHCTTWYSTPNMMQLLDTDFPKHYMETNWRLKVTYLNCSSQVASLETENKRTKPASQNKEGVWFVILSFLSFKFPYVLSSRNAVLSIAWCVLAWCVLCTLYFCVCDAFILLYIFIHCGIDFDLTKFWGVSTGQH